jgi:hypothetical protein
MAIRKSFTFNNGDKLSARFTMLDGVISKRCFERFIKKLGVRREQLICSLNIPESCPDRLCYRYKGEFFYFVERENGDILVQFTDLEICKELGIPSLLEPVINFA